MVDSELIEKFTMDDIPHDILRDIYRYWLDIKGDRNMPCRSDLNPADIVKLLPHISLIDVEKDRYKIRLVGTETVKALDTEITGKYLDELPLIEPYLKDRYDWMVREKRPYLVSGRLKWSCKSFLNFCSIGLPLSENGKDVGILMYGSYYQFPSDTRTLYPTYSD